MNQKEWLFFSNLLDLVNYELKLKASASNFDYQKGSSKLLNQKDESMIWYILNVMVRRFFKIPYRKYRSFEQFLDHIYQNVCIVFLG